MLRLCIESISFWHPGCEESQSLDDIVAGIVVPEISWPRLAFVPAMQRRRLSPFAKIALYTAENAVSQCEDQIEIIFSSRHGDLHKTSELLTALADEQDISPTAFSTSVHNAVPGLYSILKNNKQAINALSSGKDSFFYALVDAYARLKSGRCEKLLIVHTDRVLPELYQQYQDEHQIDHAVAMVVSLHSDIPLFDLDCNFEAIGVEHLRSQHQSESRLDLPAALAFTDWLSSSRQDFEFVSDRNNWRCHKYV